MEEERNLRWILVISLFMFYLQPFLQYSYTRGELKYVWAAYVTVLTIAVVSSALFTAKFGRKNLVYYVSILSFIASMGLFLIAYVWNFLTPYP